MPTPSTTAPTPQERQSNEGEKECKGGGKEERRDRVLATPLTTAASVSFVFDKNCVCLDTECLYKHIKQGTFQTRTPPQRHAQIKRVQKRYR